MPLQIAKYNYIYILSTDSLGYHQDEVYNMGLKYLFLEILPLMEAMHYVAYFMLLVHNPPYLKLSRSNYFNKADLRMKLEITPTVTIQQLIRSYKM